ncbi:MAG TPA: ABC transporter permease, partial [Fimbriimonas sp.]
MRLFKAISLRLLFGLLSLVFISLVTFIADEMAPGDAATVEAGEKASQEQVQRLRRQMGLDRPWPIRYVESATKMAQGDFGTSFFGTKEPVVDVLKRSLPVTALVALCAILLAASVGIFLGTLASIFQDRTADRSVLTLSTLGVTVPNFVLAPILQYIFALRLDQLPLTWETEL